MMKAWAEGKMKSRVGSEALRIAQSGARTPMQELVHREAVHSQHSHVVTDAA